MWDFTPYETDDYVSAEDDAVMAEHEREKKKHAMIRLETEEREDGRLVDDRIGEPQDMAQEYESPEDIYLESDDYNNDY